MYRFSCRPAHYFLTRLLVLVMDTTSLSLLTCCKAEPWVRGFMDVCGDLWRLWKQHTLCSHAHSYCHSYATPLLPTESDWSQHCTKCMRVCVLVLGDSASLLLGTESQAAGAADAHWLLAGRASWLWGGAKRGRENDWETIEEKSQELQ